MSSTLDDNDPTWQFFHDENHRVEQVARAALDSIGWKLPLLTARVALRRGAGMADPTCVAMWCVQLTGIQPEVRHCVALGDDATKMIDKFARTFEKLRSNKPLIEYEGELAEQALEAFENMHANHDTRQSVVLNDIIVTQCLDCGVEFREFYVKNSL
jgi:hypothetical protein